MDWNGCINLKAFVGTSCFSIKPNDQGIVTEDDLITTSRCCPKITSIPSFLLWNNKCNVGHYCKKQKFSLVTWLCLCMMESQKIFMWKRNSCMKGLKLLFIIVKVCNVCLWVVCLQTRPFSWLVLMESVWRCLRLLLLVIATLGCNVFYHVVQIYVSLR